MRILLRRWLRREHDCYYVRQYDAFNEGFKAASARADALAAELRDARAEIEDLREGR